MSSFLIFIVGLIAQGCFAARILVQLIKSEKQKRVVSPTLFWVLSIVGSLLFFLYGWLRDDFSIILGQCISYYVYWWNLKAKNVWQKLPAVCSYLFLLVPVLIVSMMMSNFDLFINSLFKNEGIPMWLVVFGSIGQVTFTLRFVYQWYYSKKVGDSVLPKGFWLLSLIGSSIILIYALIRLDFILILGQSFGFVSYLRNLFIGKSEKKSENSDC